MNRTGIFLLALLASACWGCKEQKGHTGSSLQKTMKTPADTLFEEVMHGHDVGMAKMGRLKKNSALLSREMDSLPKTSSNDPAKVASLQRVKDSLDAAQSAMFEWMEGFKADTLSESPAERTLYLQGQKASVVVVRDRILNSLRLFDSLQKK